MRAREEGEDHGEKLSSILPSRPLTNVLGERFCSDEDRTSPQCFLLAHRAEE
jgi:hypothetical protein